MRRLTLPFLCLFVSILSLQLAGCNGGGRSAGYYRGNHYNGYYGPGPRSIYSPVGPGWAGRPDPGYPEVELPIEAPEVELPIEPPDFGGDLEAEPY